MKRCIKSSASPKVRENALNAETLINQTWSGLVRDIYDETQWKVKDEYIDFPNKYILLVDPDGIEYEAEVTKYSNGQYELRVDNIHQIFPTPDHKKVISATNDLDFRDAFLPLEHQLDLASQEAWSLYRAQRRNNPFVSEQAHNMAVDLDKMKSKLRNLRSFVLNDSRYIDTEETMREDSSRYLED